MSPVRKGLLRLALAAFFASGTSWSQAFPSRPIRLVVPTAPGSGSDTVARVLSQPLAGRLGQPVVVDNRTGAAGMIAGEFVAKSRPDGYTLLLVATQHTITPATYKKVPYDALGDFAPIMQIMSFPNVLVVHPSLPVESVKELIGLAKTKPGEVVFASAGAGGMQHLMMELFLVKTGTRMLHVPYKSPAPAFIDLMAGRVSAMMGGIVGAGPHIQARKLRALGVTSAKRASVLPDVPTIAEAGVPAYEAGQWWGLAAPAGTPKEIVERLNREVASVLLAQEIRERFIKDGVEVVISSPEEFAALLRTESGKWARVVKDVGIQPE